jgi:tetratricopeptide (TPR) repeat protein
MRRLFLFAFVCGSLLAANPDYGRALDLYNHTEFDASLKLLLPAQEKDTAALVLIGQNYFMIGDAQHAIEFFQKAVDAEPASSVYSHWLGRAYARQAEAAGMLDGLSLAPKARRNLEKAIQLDPKNLEALDDLFEYYLEAPGFIGGGLDKAIRIADQIAGQNAAEGHYAWSRVEEKRKDFGRAEDHLRRAMQLEPREVGRVIDLAKFQAKQGHFEEGEKTFLAAQQVAPNAPKLMYARAATYIEAGRNIEIAKELLQKYIASPLTPEDPPRSDARKLLQRAAAPHPNES